MKRLLVSVLCFTLYSTSLLAWSIGPEGSPYIQNDIQWRKVKYDGDDAIGYIAAFPGSSPSSRFNMQSITTTSSCLGVSYQISARLNEIYKPPKTEKEFLNNVQEAFIEKGTATLVKSNQKTVKYIVDIRFTGESKIVRVFCSRNCLYWATVEGFDLSLAPIFFEGIQITK